MSKSIAFQAAFRSLAELTQKIDVSDLLLGVLLHKQVLTATQYDEIRVRCFTM